MTWWQWAAPRLRRASGRSARITPGSWVIIGLLLVIVLSAVLAPWI